MNDVRFLPREEALFCDATKQSNDESKSTQELKSKNEAHSWHGIEPRLRLLEACMSAHEWEDREVTDGRNSATRRKKN